MKLINEEYIFNVAPRFNSLPFIFVDTLDGTTPDISNRTVLVKSGAIVTVTNFVGGAEGQTIRIIGDNNITIQYNANIRTNTGADKILATNKAYVFTHVTGVWYEDA